MRKVKIFWKLLKMAFVEFFADGSLRHSASLSFYTIFAMAPLLIIVISLAGIFFGVDAVEGKIYVQINELVGDAAAAEIQDIIKNVEASESSRGGAIIGFIILIIGASGVFTEIQDSINYIWSVKAKPKKGWLKIIINRLLSFSLIASFGFLLLVSLLVNTLMDLLSDRMKLFLPNATIYFFQFLNVLLIFLIISCLFAIIFKVLPDALIRWRDAFIGAFFTASLFIGGKFLIGFYLSKFNVRATFGATASIILILLWVYYSSIILYFGAEFTKVYAMNYGGKIIPNDTSVFIVKQEVREIDVSIKK